MNAYSEKENKVFRWIPAIVMSLVILSCILIYFALVYDCSKRLPVQATIVDMDIINQNDEENQKVTLYCFYTIDDKEYNSTYYFTGSTFGYVISENIELWYKADNPEKLYGTNQPNPLAGILPLFLGLPLSLGVWGFCKYYTRWNYRTPNALINGTAYFDPQK